MQPVKIALLTLAGFFLLYVLYDQSASTNENYENPRIQQTLNNGNNGLYAPVNSGADTMGPTAPIPYNDNVLPYPQQSNLYQQQSDYIPPSQTSMTTQCNQPDVLKPEDLIPRPDPHSIWNLSNPPVNGSLSDRNFLESAQHFGIDTISGSKRNANQGLRSDPYIPHAEVGPWNQATIGPDTNRRQFDIGTN